jgi:hypothetical protein
MHVLYDDPLSLSLVLSLSHSLSLSFSLHLPPFSPCSLLLCTFVDSLESPARYLPPAVKLYVYRIGDGNHVAKKLN